MHRVLLGNVSSVSSGQGAPQEKKYFADHGVPFIRAGSLEKLVSGAKEDTLEKVTQEGVTAHRLRLFPGGTILFAKSGMSATKERVYLTQNPCYVVSHLAAVLPNEKLHNKYLFYWLQWQPPTHLIRDAGYPSIRLSDIEKLKIPLPPLYEQKRIAAILDIADALRQKRRCALARLDDLLQSVFLEMFGDPVTNPMGWEVMKLGDYLEFLTSGSRGWAKYYSEVGTLFLRIQNIRNNELRLNDIAYVDAPESAEKKRTTVQEGDILISITADLGRTAVIPKNFPTANINQHLALVRVSDFIPEYISAFLASAGGQIQFDRLNRQGVKAGLNFDNIKSLEVLKPPLEQQKYYKEIEINIRSFQKQYQFYQRIFDTLFHSLQQRAFRGELSAGVGEQVLEDIAG